MRWCSYERRYSKKINRISMFEPVTHVIFDVDGLLLDTERIYTEVFQGICGEYGKEYTWAVKASVMGLPAGDATAIICRRVGLPLDPEELLVESARRLHERFPSAQLMPGVERLVTHLAAHGVPLAVATGSSRESLQRKREQHASLFNHMQVVVTSDELVEGHGKPAPDIFLKAASRFIPPAQPGKCLVFEDAPNGVGGAKAAGMQVVMVPDSQLDHAFQKGATQVLTSLTEFIPETFGLPSYESEPQH
uniref:pseudouridine-5'-phosphatase n=1 Tax=Myxine glutinosa TaxID=7769 RepID=UPI00358F0089